MDIRASVGKMYVAKLAFDESLVLLNEFLIGFSKI
jgi:hypothetical protein